MYDTFNEECFSGRLPEIKISYSNRMLIAGSYMPSTREIKIGRKYHAIFPDDLADTLKHEMIHVIYPNHDRGFKALAAKLGVSLKAKAHPSLRGPYKYLYICPVCGREYPRRKRLRMASCGVCSKGSSFDPRCKLQLARVKK
ncbi:MAG: SprT-like domain-containing protein [candidate division Zixibacteria bacterium]|nr:SprT-like domain-containing protein [candidate division Zixibacteria bacterium]